MRKTVEISKYPYYVAAHVDGGQMVKLMRGKKFKTFFDCLDAVNKWSIKFPDNWNHWQIVILEYSDQYQSRIKTIFTNGECVNVE